MPGRPLDGADPVDQQWWGDRLGAAHRGLVGFDHPGLRRWNWLHPDGAAPDVEPWLRPAVADAVTAMTRLTVTDRLTYGVLHGDPAAEALRRRPGHRPRRPARLGRLRHRPAGLRRAAAVVYAGGPAAAGELLDGYLAAGPVGRDEVEAALPVLLRFRWAVQADWCAAAPAGARTAGHYPADRSAAAAARRALEATSGDCPLG